MIGDRRDPLLLRDLQQRALARYVAADVYPYSAFYRPLLDETGLGRKPSGADLLRRLPLTRLSDVEASSSLVLRPDEATIQRFGTPGLLTKVFWAKLVRRAERVNRDVIEPAYKPLRWVAAEGMPIGYTDHDLTRLGDLGRSWLGLAGLGRYDVVVSVLPPGPRVGYWELVEGCRTAGVSALFLAPTATAEQLRAIAPTVLAGRAADVARVLRAAGAVTGLHTVLVVGDALDAERRRVLAALAPGAAVCAAWAPPGVRSLWAECRGGDAVHTFPDADLVEESRGEIVWTALGWRGSVLLRLATGVMGKVDEGSCPVCGRTSPRVRPQ